MIYMDYDKKTNKIHWSYKQKLIQKTKTDWKSKNWPNKQGKLIDFTSWEASPISSSIVFMIRCNLIEYTWKIIDLYKFPTFRTIQSISTHRHITIFLYCRTINAIPSFILFFCTPLQSGHRLSQPPPIHTKFTIYYNKTPAECPAGVLHYCHCEYHYLNTTPNIFIEHSVNTEFTHLLGSLGYITMYG